MYKLTSGAAIIRLSDGASIPADEGNLDYQRYLSWVDQGNDPLPVDPPPTPTKNELLNDALKRYNADIELFSKQMSGAALADGPSEETKRAKIRAAYELRKAEYNAEVAQIKSS